MIRFVILALLVFQAALVVAVVVLSAIMLGVEILTLVAHGQCVQRTKRVECLGMQVGVVQPELEMCPWPWCGLKMLVELADEITTSTMAWSEMTWDWPMQNDVALWLGFGARAFVGCGLDTLSLPWQLWMRRKWRMRQRKRIREARMLAAIKRSNDMATDTGWRNRQPSGICILKARYYPCALSLLEVACQHRILRGEVEQF